MAAEDFNSNAGEGSDHPAVQVFEQLMAEQEGAIPPGFAKRIEKDLQDKLGLTRRLALVFLEKPFKEIVETIERDRGFAVATAHIADVLNDHIGRYESLVEWLKAAQLRMVMAGTIRPDMDAVTAEAKRDSEAARAVEHLLRDVDPGQEQ